MAENGLISEHVQVVICSRIAKPVLTCTGKNIVVEGVELHQAFCGTVTDCVAVIRGATCLRNLKIQSVMGSGVVVSGANVAAKLEACTMANTGKYGCIVSEGASVEARDTTVDGCKAAGVVSRGKGSIFRAETCTFQNNGKSLRLRYLQTCGYVVAVWVLYARSHSECAVLMVLIMP